MDAGDGDPLVIEVAGAVLSEVRKAKTEAGVSLRADVESVVVRDTPERLAALALAADDVQDAAKAAQSPPRRTTPSRCPSPSPRRTG